MNVWGDKEEGRPVDDCQIIDMLRALDSNAASLIFFSRELSCMYTRIISIIEALYKWDMNDNSGISDSDCKTAVNDSIETAAKHRLRSRISKDQITDILKKFGWDIGQDAISPLEFHIATNS